MKAELGYFITAIPMIEIQESTFIPTVLYYQSDQKTLIGFDAKAAAETNGRELLNEDFKIDLGNEDPNSANKRRFLTGSSLEKTAGDLSGEFLHQVMLSVEDWLSRKHIDERAGVIVAEPLIILGEEVENAWLKNYRDNVRRILLGKGLAREQIEFMPEPFAVFQYYKFGVNHPLLGSSKQYALVLDFGGGSFDCCIIETDKEGEITGKRRNTRPLSALSVPAGGYYLNRKIVEHLFFKYARDEKNRSLLRKGIEVYKDWRDKNKDISSIKLELQHFSRNFHNAIYEVEDPKITLCKNIYNWEIDGDLPNTAVPLRLPIDPFSETPTFFNANLTAEDFRKIFEGVWEKKLEPNIRKVFLQGKDDLKAAPITVILLSGGSCNIRWLEKLLYRDFPLQLSDVPTLPLKDDFQEVVAKGLAIECARRFYDPNSAGDFTSITYNRLNLVLDPDQTRYQLKVFNPVKDNPIPPTDSACVLLPSASVLRNHFDKPLLWKVKLDRPPRRFLNYYFLRAGFSPYLEDAHTDGAETKYSEDLLNLEHCVFTPSDCNFDSHLYVELKIGKETKTASAKFIYRMGSSEKDRVVVDGKPFYLDMTDTQDNPKSKAYLGLDFGTSNTSVSFINQKNIQIYQKRASEKLWRDLNDLCLELPYPLSIALTKYIRETDKSKMVKLALEFVESALALSAYISYLDMCSQKDVIGSFFGKLRFRSVGPLWKLLQNSVEDVSSAHFSREFKELTSDFNDEIDKAVAFFNEHKHEKAADSSFDQRIVEIIANICQKAFSNFSFGFFENVQPERINRGSFKGIFRVAHGNNVNFVVSEEYVGEFPFPPNVLYLVDFAKSKALPLEPLLFWYRCEKHTDIEHCFLFDSEKENGFSYKAAGISCQFLLDGNHAELGQYSGIIDSWRRHDAKVELITF